MYSISSNVQTRATAGVVVMQHGYKAARGRATGGSSIAAARAPQKRVRRCSNKRRTWNKRTVRKNTVDTGGSTDDGGI